MTHRSPFRRPATPGPRRIHQVRAALLLAVAPVVLAGCAEDAARVDDAAGAAPALLGPNDVATLARADLVSGIPVSGTLDPVTDVAVSSPVPEVVQAILVREGQAVREGQLLGRMSTASLEPAAASAAARARIAQADYERMQALFAEGAVARTDVENAELAMLAARAAEAQAQKQLREAELRAPVAGVVAARYVDAGDRVKDGEPILRVVNTAELEFAATVPAEAAGRVRVGSPVAFTVTGGLNGTVAGRVARVNATVDPATRQLQVYVRVPNRDRALVGGVFASGRVVQREVRDALAVPATGVRREADGTPYVLVIEDGRIVRRDVRTGITDEVQELVEIVEGLAEGEVAITGPIEGLAPGVAVQIVGQEG